MRECCRQGAMECSVVQYWMRSSLVASKKLSDSNCIALAESDRRLPYHLLFANQMCRAYPALNLRTSTWTRKAFVGHATLSEEINDPVCFRYEQE